MKLQTWLQSVPESLTADPLWSVEAYRLATFVADMAWADADQLARDQRTRRVAQQLYSAVCSIGANLAEGYSRESGRDRARFYEYALGSAREARDWYYKGRHVLGQSAGEQMEILTQIMRLLFAMVKDQRGTSVREGAIEYTIPTIEELVANRSPA